MCRNTLASHYKGGGKVNPHKFARDDLAQVSSRPIEESAAWHPWSGYYLMDQIAFAAPEAMDVYASIWDEVQRIFEARPSIFHAGFLPERLLGTRLRAEAANGTLKVRVVDWVQWGVRREVEPREYQDG